MRKILGLWQIISFFSIILSFPVACNNNNQPLKLGIYGSAMSEVTTRVSLNQENYETALTKDNLETGAKCFLNLLKDHMNQFAKENAINSLDYGADYKFSVEGIDVYSNINKFETITVDVKASTVTKKITGVFQTKVDLVKSPKSINNLAPQGKFSYNKVEVNKTQFQDVVTDYLETIIKSQIDKVAPQAKPLIDYGINFQGYNLLQTISQDALGTRIVSVNAVGASSNPLLEGSFSFEVDLSVKKV